MQCRRCTFEAPTAGHIAGHARKVHGVKNKPSRAVKAETPDEPEADVVSEEELLAEVIAWFECAQPSRSAARRIIAYLASRYAEPESWEAFHANGKLAHVPVGIGGIPLGE